MSCLQCRILASVLSGDRLCGSKVEFRKVHCNKHSGEYDSGGLRTTPSPTSLEGLKSHVLRFFLFAIVPCPAPLLPPGLSVVGKRGSDYLSLCRIGMD